MGEFLGRHEVIALAGTVGATLSSWLPLTMLAILKLLGLNFGKNGSGKGLI